MADTAARVRVSNHTLLAHSLRHSTCVQLHSHDTPHRPSPSSSSFSSFSFSSLQRLRRRRLLLVPFFSASRTMMRASLASIRATAKAAAAAAAPAKSTRTQGFKRFQSTTAHNSSSSSSSGRNGSNGAGSDRQFSNFRWIPFVLKTSAVVVGFGAVWDMLRDSNNERFPEFVGQLRLGRNVIPEYMDNELSHFDRESQSQYGPHQPIKIDRYPAMNTGSAPGCPSNTFPQQTTELIEKSSPIFEKRHGSGVVANIMYYLIGKPILIGANFFQKSVIDSMLNVYYSTKPVSGSFSHVQPLPVPAGAEEYIQKIGFTQLARNPFVREEFEGSSCEFEFDGMANCYNQNNNGDYQKNLKKCVNQFKRLIVCMDKHNMHPGPRRVVPSTEILRKEIETGSHPIDQIRKGDSFQLLLQAIDATHRLPLHDNILIPHGRFLLTRRYDHYVLTSFPSVVWGDIREFAGVGIKIYDDPEKNKQHLPALRRKVRLALEEEERQLAKQAAHHSH